MRFHRRLSQLGLIGLAATLGVNAALADTGTGPSSSLAPVLVPSQPGVRIGSLLSVGDSAGVKPDGTPYRMVGIPDGLGAFDNGDGTFTVLMNHELQATVGITRSHGATGALVSKWTIRKSDMRVLNGQDLIQQIVTWNAAGAYNPPASGVALSRLCSAALGAPSSFSYQGLGYNGHIFMNGEETGTEGRAFAHLMNGTSYELPWLGKFAWENAVPHPDGGKYTVVAGLDDGQNGQVYFYIGEKTASSQPIEAAGLSNGTLYGVRVAGLVDESNTTALSGPTAFDLVAFSGVASKTGVELDTASEAAGVTSFQRPEDGVWNPARPDEFYFVTTASFTGNSRLWRMRFSSAPGSAAVGTIEMLLDGTEGPRMMDNLTMSADGKRLIIQEDPGNQTHLARIWEYVVATDRVTEVARHNPASFDPTSPTFITQDEESSGVIDISTILGNGWFLLDSQIHAANPDPELVESGQLLLMYVPPQKP